MSSCCCKVGRYMHGYASNLSNLMVCLLGPPGVGKYTIGSFLAQRLPAKLIDNHHWLNPLFSLIEQDGRTPLPEEIWTQAAQVRRAVFQTIATLSPLDWNFVLTLAVTGDEADREIASEVIEMARRRGARLLMVQLTCSPEELAARVVSPERRLRMKETDAEAARLNAVLPPFDPGHDDVVTVDTTGLSASAVAEHVMQRVLSVTESP